MSDDLPDDVKAIATLLTVLKPLEPDAQIHVLEFVLKRLNIQLTSLRPPSRSEPDNLATDQPATPRTDYPPLVASDIRSLAAEKMPQSVNEKVALMAFYLANYAPASERRDYITSDDIKTYFVQANFELPNGPPSTALKNAKNAGYLNAMERGQYRLNSVGHNLVAHKLPKKAQSSSKSR